MKILYIGTERSDAQAIATALRGIDHDATVTWASRLDLATSWLDANQGVASLVVDAHSHGGSWPAVLTHVRDLGLHPAVVVIVPEGTGPFDSFHPDAHDYIVRNQSLLRDLPFVVTRSIGRAWAHQRIDLEQQLGEATAALEDAEHRHRKAIEAVQVQLAERQAQYDIGLARATAAWEMVDEQLRAAAIEVERARRDQAIATADVRRLVQREAELATQLADLTATHRAVEHRLADSETAVADAHTRAEQQRIAAAEQLALREREFHGRIAQEIDRRRIVEDLLAHAVKARDEAEKRHAAAIADAAARSRELDSALAATRQDLDAKTADVEQLAMRERDLSASLADLTSSRHDLERRLAATEAAFDDAATRATRDRLAVSKKAAEREAELDGQLQQERATCTRLEQAIADGQAALEVLRRDHASALVEIDRLSQREADLTARLAQVEAERHAVEVELTEATHTIAQASDTIAQASAREAELNDQLRCARESHATDIERLTEREAELDGQLREERATCTRLEHAIADGDAALEALRRDHASTLVEIDRLSQREADLTARLAQVEAERHAVEVELTEATQKLAQASAREAELNDQLRCARESHAADIERLANREAELEGQLREERATRTALEQAIADGEAALEALRRDQASALVEIDRLAQREADLTARLAQVEAERHAVEVALTEATHTIAQASAREAELNDQLRCARESHAADIERLAEREAELASELAAIDATCRTLEHQLTDAARSIADASEQAAREQEDAARRRADLEARLEQDYVAREALEQALADADLALRDRQRRHDDALAAAAHELAAHRADSACELSTITAKRDAVMAQLSDAETAFDQLQRDYRSSAADVARLTHREADLVAQLADVEDARNALEQQQAGAVQALADAAECATRERAAAAECQADLEARLAEQIATTVALEGTLADARASALDATRAFNDQADALRAQEREHVAQFDVQLAQQRLEYEQRLSEAEETVRVLAQERGTLQQQLDESRGEAQRLFDHAGLAMFRCTRDGALIEANRACTTLVGRRTISELHGVDFMTAVFEAPNVLSWLIERCVSTKAKETVETTWRRKEGGRLFVRLSGRLMTGGVIEIAVDDLTRVRVLQERLDQSTRMEAVGRFASEVAVTCGNLLSDIHVKSQEWLTTVGGDVASRQYGELLFDEVKRAAGFLEEIAHCGDEQARTPMLVDLNTLIHDLEPVLKRVAGGDVEVQLRDTSARLNVEVGTERVERLLVNLASYGRQRMPFGGRLRIELGTSVVDRRFAAKHPNVRLGRHALITVTETTDGRSNGTPRDRADSPARSSTGTAIQRPGVVDFGTLQGLVNECGGHLWMKVQPPGDMVAKIRLPLSNPTDTPLPRSTGRGRDRGAARWFQS